MIVFNLSVINSLFSIDSLIKIKIFYLLVVYLSIQASCGILYMIIPKYKIKEIANTEHLALEVRKKVVCGAACASYCKDPICSGFTYYEGSQECVLNRYGRIILEADSAAITWVKRM